MTQGLNEAFGELRSLMLEGEGDLKWSRSVVALLVRARALDAERFDKEWLPYLEVLDPQRYFFNNADVLRSAAPCLPSHSYVFFLCRDVRELKAVVESEVMLSINGLAPFREFFSIEVYTCIANSQYAINLKELSIRSNSAPEVVDALVASNYLYNLESLLIGTLSAQCILRLIAEPKLPKLQKYDRRLHQICKVLGT